MAGEGQEISSLDPIIQAQVRDALVRGKSDELPIPSMAGVTVSRISFDGSSNQDPEREMRYTGFTVDTPDLRFYVTKAPNGMTAVAKCDRQGRPISEEILNSNLGKVLNEAVDIYPPHELPHLVDSVINLSRREKEELEQRIQAAGGLFTYTDQEAGRSVQEGAYPDIEAARKEIARRIYRPQLPYLPITEKLTAEAINSNLIPADINDPQEAGRIMESLDHCARSPETVEAFARELPALQRINTLIPLDRAKAAFGLVQTFTSVVLGSKGRGDSGIGNVTFEDTAQLPQKSLNVAGLGISGRTAVAEVLEYAWNKVSQLQQAAGVPSGKPRFNYN